GMDLDLHVHQPNTTSPWSVPGLSQDCTWSTCTINAYMPPQAANAAVWFSDMASPPDPVNWFLDPVVEHNNCYFVPHGVGTQWQQLGLGCHSPRLDLDSITCNPTITDPNDFSFCTPENVNIDFPPTDAWMRVGVHYYSNHQLTYDLHPRIAVWCN